MAITQAYEHLLHLGALKFPDGLGDEEGSLSPSFNLFLFEEYLLFCLDDESDDLENDMEYGGSDSESEDSDESYDEEDEDDLDSDKEPIARKNTNRTTLDETVVTYLGRFLSGLPIDMELGKDNFLLYNGN